MQVNPQNLQQLRKQKRLSRAKLAALSHISQKQIQRLEDPQEASDKVREVTLKRLAKALGVKPEELTAPQTPLPTAENPARISSALLPGVSLAYALIKRHYGVTPSQIINMAPLFFTLLAEGSLAWRKKELAELQESLDRIETRGDWGRNRFLLHVCHALDGSCYVEEAIEKGDLFNDPLPDDYEFESEDIVNPFVDYLRKLSLHIGKPGIVNAFGSYALGGHIGCTYDVCRDDLDKLAGSGTPAQYALKTGDVGVSEIPDELMSDTAADKRAEWLESKLSKESRKILKASKEFLKQF